MMFPLFLGKIGLTEILIVLVIVVIFFGGRKIPELMRGMGRGVREFKDAIDGKPGSDAPDATARTEQKPGAEAPKDDTAGSAPKS